MEQVAIITLGCRLNQSEGDALRMVFAQQGKRVTNLVYPTVNGQNGSMRLNTEPLDIAVINTCAVTEQAVRTSIKWIRRMANLKPKPKIIVTGCLAEIERARLQKENGVDEVFSQSEKIKLIEELETRIDQSAEGCPILPSRARAFLKIQDGCFNRCTYCLPAQIRGEPISKPTSLVEKGVRDLVAMGYQEIVLVGLNLGIYGLDTGTSLFDLLGQLAKIKANFRIRLGCLEPDSFDYRILERFDDFRLCHHLHIPLQSGDDKILNLMQRKYSVAQYEALINRIVDRIPDINLGTDLICGFPGEDDISFSRTVNLIRNLPFGYLHIFPYSPRPKTKAFTIPETVSPKEKKARVNLLRALSRIKSFDYRNRFRGKIREAIIESNQKAITDNYIRVFIPDGNGDRTLHLRPGRITKVRIIEVTGDKTVGQLIETFSKSSKCSNGSK
ncbi:MAG: MiaB/RimO family radical SAM methylthiotransferase [candidate division WOR-3 bacterium]